VGAVCRVRAVVDGRTVAVEEIGDCEQPHNWPHDGARLKDAMSDALKRCGMRLGVGLHLWSQDEFTLYGQLQKRAEDAETPSQRDNGSLLDGNEGSHGAPDSARCPDCAHSWQKHRGAGCTAIDVIGIPNEAGSDRPCGCKTPRPPDAACSSAAAKPALLPRDRATGRGVRNEKPL